jgi:hypothetical protein
MAGNVLSDDAAVLDGMRSLCPLQLANICQEEISLRTKELTEVETKAQKDIADLNAMLGTMSSSTASLSAFAGLQL